MTAELTSTTARRATTGGEEAGRRMREAQEGDGGGQVGQLSARLNQFEFVINGFQNRLDRITEMVVQSGADTVNTSTAMSAMRST